jgi:hypothetical protein
MNHPQLGEINYTEEGWWEGRRDVNGLALEVNVEGAEAGPDPRLVNELLNVLAHFDQIWADGLRLIREEAPRWGVRDVKAFTPACVCHFWAGKPRYFMMYLSLAGDEYGLWKLEFYDHRAKYLSRDD